MLWCLSCDNGLFHDFGSTQEILILSSKHISKYEKMLYSSNLCEVTQKLAQITCFSLLHCFWLWINLFWQTNTTSKKHLMRNISDWTGWKYVQKSQLDRLLTCVSRCLTIRTCLLRPSVFENKWYLKTPHGPIFIYCTWLYPAWNSEFTPKNWMVGFDAISFWDGLYLKGPHVNFREGYGSRYSICETSPPTTG